jgi:hypothetical protein
VVFNAPTIYTDPSGQAIWFAIFALAVIGAGGAGAYYGATTGQESGPLEGFIPGWGAGRTAGAAFANGEPVKGVFYALLVPVDVCVVSSVGSGLVRLGGRGFMPARFSFQVGPLRGVGRTHMSWNVGGRYYHSLGGRARLFPPYQQRIILFPDRPARRVFLENTTNIPFLPVANRGLARLTGLRSSDCYTAAFRAWSRGNYHLPPYILTHGSLDLGFGLYHHRPNGDQAILGPSVPHYAGLDEFTLLDDEFVFVDTLDGFSTEDFDFLACPGSARCSSALPPVCSPSRAMLLTRGD